MPELLAVNKNLFVEDAWQLDVFKGTGGYERARRALTEMSPEDLIAMMEASGLKGRGGAFFPTGMKWKFVRADPNTPRYVIANGDESEPGTFCNRFNMELDPHLFIEGMIIAAYAVDSHFGYIYIRGEYGRAIERVEQAACRLLRGRHSRRGRLGVRLQAGPATAPRGGSIHLRRRDGAVQLARRQARQPPVQAAVSHELRRLEKAHRHQQHRDVRLRSVDSRKRRRVVFRTWAKATRTPERRSTVSPALSTTLGSMSCRWA